MKTPAEHENSNPYLINPLQFAGSLLSPVLAVHILFECTKTSFSNLNFIQNFKLSTVSAEHKKKFITSEPDLD